MVQNRGTRADKPNGKAGTTLRVPVGSANKKRVCGPSRQARVGAVRTNNPASRHCCMPGAWSIEPVTPQFAPMTINLICSQSYTRSRATANTSKCRLQQKDRPIFQHACPLCFSVHPFKCAWAPLITNPHGETLRLPDGNPMVPPRLSDWVIHSVALANKSPWGVVSAGMRVCRPMWTFQVGSAH